MPAGRPPLPFHEGQADQILEAIADGQGLVSFLKQREDMPSYSTVMRWIRDNPEFAEMYTRACEDMADNDADKISDVAERVIRGEIEPQAARVAIEAYKWSAGKRRPRKYGDKIEIDQTTRVAVTHTLDVTNLSLEELDALEKALSNG